MKKNIILLGAGGHMTSVIETIKNDKRYKIVGFLDNDKKKIGKKIFGIQVIGNDNKLKLLRKKINRFWPVILSHLLQVKLCS